MKRRELLESLVALPLIGLVTKAGRMKREVEVPKLVPPPKPIEAEDVGLPEFEVCTTADSVYIGSMEPFCPRCADIPHTGRRRPMSTVWMVGERTSHWQCDACGFKTYDINKVSFGSGRKR